MREAGKTLPDALGEVREAVDFLRYYADARAATVFGNPPALPGPTGESNELSLHGPRRLRVHLALEFPAGHLHGPGRGRLAAGNAVLAKPAEQTPLIARAPWACCTQPACPAACCIFIPGRGRRSARRCVADPRVAGVAFTGSTATAKVDQPPARRARRHHPVPLIAETGGQNAMFVDSSALPEQVVRDVIASAFNSAGQRCSALRVLFCRKRSPTA